MRSLKFKFFLGALVIIVLTLIGSVLVFNISLSRYFSDYQLRETARQLEDFEQHLESVYRETGDFSRVREEIRDYTSYYNLIYHPAPGPAGQDDRGGMMRDDRGPPHHEHQDHGPHHDHEDRQKRRESMMHEMPEEGFEIYVDNNYIGLITWPRRDDRSALAAEIDERTEEFVSDVYRFMIPLTAGLIIVAALLTYYLGSRLAGPLNRLVAAVSKLREENYDVEISIDRTSELKNLSEEINQLGNRLKYLERVRRESASDFSHELRTPVNNLLNYVTALEDGILEPDEETIAELKEETRRLVELSGRIKDLAAAEKKIHDMNMSSTNLTDMVNELDRVFRSRAEEKGLDFNSSFSLHTEVIKTDPEALRSIIQNLLSNAIKYTDEGGEVEFLVRSMPQDELLIAVADTGMGIDEEDQELIFERFYRTDDSRSRDTGGSGIGLAITKELVEALNGEIDLESSERGSTFTVKIPLKKSRKK